MKCYHYIKTAPASAMPEEEEGQISSPTLTRRRGLKGNNQLNEMMPKIIVALFIIVIIVVVWYLSQQQASNKSDYRCWHGRDSRSRWKTVNRIPIKIGARQNADEEEWKNRSEEEPEEPEEPQQTLAFESASGETRRMDLQMQRNFKLEIRLTGDSWIGVSGQRRKRMNDTEHVL